MQKSLPYKLVLCELHLLSLLVSQKGDRRGMCDAHCGLGGRLSGCGANQSGDRLLMEMYP